MVISPSSRAEQTLDYSRPAGFPVCVVTNTSLDLPLGVADSPHAASGTPFVVDTGRVEGLVTGDAGCVGYMYLALP